MPAKQEPKRTLRRRKALIEYDDGRVEELNLAKPIYEYEITQAGIDAVGSADSVFWTLWLAAGKPGGNGHPLDADRDRPLMRDWIASLAAYEFPDAEAVPPTTPPATSRISAG